MKAEIHYCRSWFRVKKIAIETYGETVAQAKHNAGVSYTALIGSATNPTCFVELILDKGMIGVGFLDEHLREYMTYQFQRVEDGRLFLSMVTHREFVEEDDKVREGTTYFFDPCGEVVIRRQTFNPRLIEKMISSFNPENNYETFPDFGEYSDLIKAERQ